MAFDVDVRSRCTLPRALETALLVLLATVMVPGIATCSEGNGLWARGS